MLGGLPADQGAAGLHTALAHALDNLLDPLRHVLSAGDVVQEEQGLRAAADDIVHTHCDAVDTDRVVFVHQEGDLQLRAHAVRAGNQYRLFHPAEIRLKQAAEAAHILAYTGNAGPPDVLFHQFNGFVAGGDIHPRGGIGF